MECLASLVSLGHFGCLLFSVCLVYVHDSTEIGICYQIIGFRTLPASIKRLAHQEQAFCILGSDLPVPIKVVEAKRAFLKT
jgi:hypothetical protein